MILQWKKWKMSRAKLNICIIRISSIFWCIKNKKKIFIFCILYLKKKNALSKAKIVGFSYRFMLTVFLSFSLCAYQKVRTLDTVWSAKFSFDPTCCMSIPIGLNDRHFFFSFTVFHLSVQISFFLSRYTYIQLYHNRVRVCYHEIEQKTWISLY